MSKKPDIHNVSPKQQAINIVCAKCNKPTYWDELTDATEDGLLICSECAKKKRSKK